MFHFKQFSLSDEKSAMKIGMDAVLLGAWANLPVSGNILDIGTGTGIIALMMAQRCNALIDAVEINKDAADEAIENVTLSPWAGRVKIYHSPIQSFAKDSSSAYELILCNPPFFSKSLKSPLENRNAARHNDLLPLNELMQSIQQMLAPTGRFAIIIPSGLINSWINSAASFGLNFSRSVAVISRQGKEANRHLVEFQYDKSEFEESVLIIRDMEGRYSEEYKRLTFDFYLGL
ncbi:MAG: methyltransferase [Bacteroidetes bacterium]|nr:methyltransferase [Bacteroidota bacterium]